MLVFPNEFPNERVRGICSVAASLSPFLPYFYGVNRLLLKMNFCTDKKISVFWLIVNSLDPTNRSSVDNGIGRLSNLFSDPLN
jgi:hypothetical protein